MSDIESDAADNIHSSKWFHEIFVCQPFPNNYNHKHRHQIENIVKIEHPLENLSLKEGNIIEHTVDVLQTFNCGKKKTLIPAQKDTASAHLHGHIKSVV